MDRYSKRFEHPSSVDCQSNTEKDANDERTYSRTRMGNAYQHANEKGFSAAQTSDKPFRLKPGLTSAFRLLSPEKTSRNNESGDTNQSIKSCTRKIKVAKASYSDHGSHSNSKRGVSDTNATPDSLLKRLTMMLEKTYERIDSQESDPYIDNSHNTIENDNTTEKIDSKVNTITRAQISLDNHVGETIANENASRLALALGHKPSFSPTTKYSPNPPSALSSPQMAHNQRTKNSQNERTHAANLNQPSGLHAALNGSRGSSSSRNIKGNYDNSAEAYPHAKGEPLTTPSHPSCNNGLDNDEGNLIVHKNDILSIPKHHITHHSSQKQNHRKSNNSSKSGRNETITFLVLELLGQGTFAQVFKCQNISTGELVAIKIVKNKPAYTRQAAIEIDVFRSLCDDTRNIRHSGQDGNRSQTKSDNMVKLICYFMYHSHLCLVFELLGLNLYEVLKRRQFRGLPINLVQTLVRQAIEATRDLSQQSVVHCDLKPENILLVDDDVIASLTSSRDANNLLRSSSDGREGNTQNRSDKKNFNEKQKIKLIDFGSACFEGQTAHTYIQSRFYRSPEVLVGLPYDSAIDVWSLGCVAAELFLGLPILPGIHEHDQLGRISEMIAPLPDWMVEQGTKAMKYYVKTSDSTMTSPTDNNSRRSPDSPRAKSVPPPIPTRMPNSGQSTTPPPPRTNWRLKTWNEYLASLSPKEEANRRDLAKLDQQSTNRYFKRKHLSDIVMLHGQNCSSEDKKMLHLFVHFLRGTLDPDPWKRWTAHQASMHPFVTHNTPNENNRWENETHRRGSGIYWVPPWDPSICRRKLLSVQKAREKQAQLRRDKTAVANRRVAASRDLNRAPQWSTVEAALSSEDVNPASPGCSATRVTALTDAMSLTQSIAVHAASLPNLGPPRTGARTPPPSLGVQKSASTLESSHHGVQNHSSHGMIANEGAQSYHRSTDGNRYMNPLTPTRHPSGGTVGHAPQHGANRIEAHRYSPAAAFVMSPSMHSMNYSGYGRDYPYNLQHLSPMTGPQSFSGVYYDRISTHLPTEADLAYALQRPGVVPSMGGGTHANLAQQQSNNAYQYMTHNLPNVGTSSGVNVMAAMSPRHVPMHQSSQDLQLEPFALDTSKSNTQGGNLVSSRQRLSTKSPANKGSSNKGLLAQQLAEHMAATTNRSSHTATTPYQQPNRASQQVQAPLNYQHHATPPSYHHLHVPQQHVVYGSASSMNLASTPVLGRSYLGVAPPGPNGPPPPMMLSTTAPTNCDYRTSTSSASMGNHHFATSPSNSYGGYQSSYQVQILRRQQMQPPTPGFLHEQPIGLDLESEQSNYSHTGMYPRSPHYYGMSM